MSKTKKWHSCDERCPNCFKTMMKLHFDGHGTWIHCFGCYFDAYHGDGDKTKSTSPAGKNP